MPFLKRIKAAASLAARSFKARLTGSRISRYGHIYQAVPVSETVSASEEDCASVPVQVTDRDHERMHLVVGSHRVGHERFCDQTSVVGTEVIERTSLDRYIKTPTSDFCPPNSETDSTTSDAERTFYHKGGRVYINKTVPPVGNDNKVMKGLSPVSIGVQSNIKETPSTLVNVLKSRSKSNQKDLKYQCTQQLKEQIMSNKEILLQNQTSELGNNSVPLPPEGNPVETGSEGKPSSLVQDSVHSVVEDRNNSTDVSTSRDVQDSSGPTQDTPLTVEPTQDTDNLTESSSEEGMENSTDCVAVNETELTSGSVVPIDHNEEPSDTAEAGRSSSSDLQENSDSKLNQSNMCDSCSAKNNDGAALANVDNGGLTGNIDTSSTGDRKQEEDSNSMKDTHASKEDSLPSQSPSSTPCESSHDGNSSSPSCNEGELPVPSSSSQTHSNGLSSHELSSDEVNDKNQNQHQLSKRKALVSHSKRNAMYLKRIKRKQKQLGEVQPLPNKVQQPHSSKAVHSTLQKVKKKRFSKQTKFKLKRKNLRSGLKRKAKKTKKKFVRKMQSLVESSTTRTDLPSDDPIPNSDVEIKQHPPRKKWTNRVIPKEGNESRPNSDLSEKTPGPPSLDSEVHVRPKSPVIPDPAEILDDDLASENKPDETDEDFSSSSSSFSDSVLETSFIPSDSVLVCPTPPSLFQPSDDPPTVSPHDPGLFPVTAGMQEAMLPFSNYQEKDDATGQLLVLPGEELLERDGDRSSQMVCAAPPTRPHLPLIASFVVIVALSFCETGVSLREAILDCCRVPGQVRRMLVTLIQDSLQTRRVIVPCQGMQCLDVIRVTRCGEIIVPEEHLVTCTGPRTQLQMLRCLVVMVDYFLEDWDGENIHVVDGSDHGCHLRPLREFVNWARELINRGIVAVEDILLQALHHLEDWTLDQ